MVGKAQSHAKRNPHVSIRLDNGRHMTRKDPPDYYRDDTFSSLLRLQNQEDNRLGPDEGEYEFYPNVYVGPPDSEKWWQVIERRDNQGNDHVHAELVFHPAKTLGDDNMWVVMTNIGRGAFKLLPDTGSSDIWVLDAKAKVNNKNIYKVHEYQREGRRHWKNEAVHPFRPQHGILDGLIYDKQATARIDIIKIGGMEVIHHTFGVARCPTPYFVRMPLEGVLGLAFPPLSAENFTPFLHDALSKPLSGFKSGIFAFYLAARNSQLRIGGIGQPDVFVDGSIEYHNLISPEHRSGHWEIGGGRVKMKYRDHHDDWKIKETEIVSGFPAIIDSGINMILAPEEQVKKIYDKIPGSAFLGIYFSWPNGKEWLLNRHSFTIYVDPRKSICLGAIQMKSPTKPHYHNRWVLGSSFMTNVFTVFDMVKLRVGFGQCHIVTDQQRYPSPPSDLDSETLVQLTRWDPLAWHPSLLQLGQLNQRTQSNTPQEHRSSESFKGPKHGLFASPQDTNGGHKKPKYR